MSRSNHTTPTSDIRWPARAEAEPPGEHTVQVWCSVLRCEPQAIPRFQSTLPTDERERASRFRTEELRHRFIVSRIVLRRILSGSLGVEPDRIQLRTDADGKPCLADSCGIEFNLAHTGDLMLVAVTCGIPVGVDVERIRQLNDSQAIARRFFTQREANWLQRVNAAGLNRAFFSLWTRKEAILKATGEGISSGLDSLELLNDDESFRQSVARGGRDSAEKWWILRELDPAVGFVGALALPVTAGRLQLQAATIQAA